MTRDQVTAALETFARAAEATAAGLNTFLSVWNNNQGQPWEPPADRPWGS